MMEWLAGGSDTLAPAAHVEGGGLSSLWGVPFVGLLLSIAFLPLLAPHFWERHFGKIASFWCLALIAPFIVTFGVSSTLAPILEALLLDYLPFIVLLFSLFVVAGGISVTGNLSGTPATNTAILAFGTLSASFIGTTGASLILIRPIIKANQDRAYNVHVFVFFIFLVANIGGSLTPLGDPPLFLGFLT
jgi:Na+/H+ antiporter NhaD/arsenite permease-like protein